MEIGESHKNIQNKTVQANLHKEATQTNELSASQQMVLAIKAETHIAKKLENTPASNLVTKNQSQQIEDNTNIKNLSAFEIVQKIIEHLVKGFSVSLTNEEQKDIIHFQDISNFQDFIEKTSSENIEAKTSNSIMSANFEASQNLKQEIESKNIKEKSKEIQREMQIFIGESRKNYNQISEPEWQAFINKLKEFKLVEAYLGRGNHGLVFLVSSNNPKPKSSVIKAPYLDWHPTMIDMTKAEKNKLELFENDEFSDYLQKLSYDSSGKYIGEAENFLATEMLPGQKIINEEIQGSKFVVSANEKFVKEGLNDKFIVQLIKFLKDKASKGIDLTDFGGHNCLYHNNHLYFFDLGSSIDADANNANLDFLKQYPMVLALNNLMTKTLLHESSKFSSLKEANINAAKDLNIDNYYEDKFKQLEACLKKAIEEKITSREEIQEAINKLIEFHNGSQEGEPKLLANVDYQEFTDEGINYLQRLKKEF